MNMKKDQLSSLEGNLLGSVCDMVTLRFRIPPHKIEEVRSLIQSYLAKKCQPVRFLAKIIGKLASFHLSLGPILRLMMTNSYRIIVMAHSWRNYVSLNSMALKELNWWLENLTQVNGFDSSHPCQSQTCFFTWWSIASSQGMFLGVLSNGSRTLVSQLFTPEQASKSST